MNRVSGPHYITTCGYRVSGPQYSTTCGYRVSEPQYITTCGYRVSGPQYTTTCGYRVSGPQYSTTCGYRVSGPQYITTCGYSLFSRLAVYRQDLPVSINKNKKRRKEIWDCLPCCRHSIQIVSIAVLLVPFSMTSEVKPLATFRTT
jgi:cystathionine beta-lyase family protein involved in aluminum resistance